MLTKPIEHKTDVQTVIIQPDMSRPFEKIPYELLEYLSEFVNNTNPDLGIKASRLRAGLITFDTPSASAMAASYTVDIKSKMPFMTFDTPSASAKA